MKRTFSKISFFLICLLNVGAAFSQKGSTYNWRLGFGVGYTNYYGDVSNYRTNQLRNLNRFVSYNKYEHNQPSISLILNKNITPTLGLMIQANHHQFGASDRYRQRNGAFDTASINYSRSLNFRTTLQDAGIAFSFNANNGRIFKENAFFYPAVFVGAGISTFNVKGDLYDEKGNRYDYRLPGNITDGIFETDLRSMRTETQSTYPKVQPYINLGLALNFRLNGYITLAVQSDLKYSGSDYLDDVSKTYKTAYPTPEESYAARPGYNTVNPLSLQRGDNNNVNDFYINNRLVLNIGLSKKTQPKAFRPPVIYSLGRTNTYEKTADTLIKKRIQDSLLVIKADSLRKVEKDSLDRELNLSLKELSVKDSSLQKEMQLITAELKDIKEILNTQALRPRYQQLQSQVDSVKTLRDRILTQRVVSREDNLRVRIYDLQTDSLNNELEKLEQKSQHPSDSTDIYNRTSPQQILIEKPVGNNARNIEQQNAADSIDIRVYNDAVTVLKQDERYTSDVAYQRMVDSLQQRINSQQKLAMETNMSASNDKKASLSKSDSIINKAYQQRIDSLLEKLDSLEKNTVYVDTPTQPKESRISGQPSTDTIAVNAQISELETRLKQNADSVALVNRQLQLAADSAAYYERAASTPDETAKPKKKKWYQIFGSRKIAADSAAYYERADSSPDETTKPKKKKWYQIFGSRKKKVVEQETTISERNIDQQRYYDNEVNRMRRVTDEMDRRNRQLAEEYEALNTDRNRQRMTSRPSEPVVIYDRNSTRPPDRDYDEILALRRELERLRYQVNESNLNDINNKLQHGRDPVNAGIPTPVDTSANNQVTLLKSALEQIRNELDSLRSNRQPVLIERPVEKAEVFDPKKFPVVSVYFKIGAIVLPQDQITKISPFSRVAADNKAVIVLKGFTDPIGNPAINTSIAGKRAAYVKSLLVSQYNIKEDRIVIREPSVSTSVKTQKANALDRRVDLRFE